LLGPADVTVADIDICLAHCYWHQERLPWVRPLLVEALNIYQTSLPLNSKKTIVATLKLSQLDLDQNRYDDAKVELDRAISAAQKYFKKDTLLNYECLNTYACYLDEKGLAKEARETFDKAEQLKPTDLIEE
jgi:tetratricopeptide (TPR) repeat protein